MKIRLKGLPRIFSSPYEKKEIAKLSRTNIKVQCPSGPLVVGERSSNNPAPKPTDAATSGELRAAQTKVNIRKIENPPAGKVNWLIRDSCAINTSKKIALVNENFLINMAFNLLNCLKVKVSELQKQ